ncbi:MAG: RrF2 family transcriptional regulator [Candidatus Zixiibacteriota bacterium]
MIFSPTCQYALRALIYLATHEKAGPVLGRTIAESETIPRQFLSKILHSLRNSGLVTSTMGPGGGYELARPARSIAVREVVAAIDGPLTLDETCVLGLDECSDKNSCALHDQWKVFRERLEKSISSLTLEQASATLVKKRKTVRRRR